MIVFDLFRFSSILALKCILTCISLEYCAKLYGNPPPYHENGNKKMVVEDAKASTVNVGRGVSTIVLTADCVITVYENEDFGGAAVEFISPSSETIFELENDFPDWDNKISSYECSCPELSG